MRASLFTRRRLRSSYRNVPMDVVVALIEEACQEDDFFVESHKPRRFRRAHHEQEWLS